MFHSRLRHYLERIVGGGTPSRKVAAFWEGDIPWASVKDFREGALFLKGTQETISAQGLKASASNLIEAGVPIVCTRIAVGRAAITQCAVAINQDLKALYPNSQLDAKYLVWWLEYTRPKIEAQAIGSTVRGISLDTLLNWPVNFPLFPEQQRIAEILDTIDTAIQRTEALIAKLKAAKAGLLHDLLTRGLDEKGGLQKHENQSALPPHWNVCPLVEVADIAAGVTLGRKFYGSDTVELPYLRVANVQDGFLNLSEVKTVRIQKSEVPRYLLQAGDILLTEGGDFDKLGRGTVWDGSVPNCLHQNHIFRVRPNPKLLNPWFLAAVFASYYGKAYFLASAKQTTNLASINSTQLKAFPVPMPSLAEQERITELLDSYGAQIKAEEAQLAKLHQLKRGLMEDLLTGRVRVPLAQPEATQAEAVN